MFSPLTRCTIRGVTCALALVAWMAPAAAEQPAGDPVLATVNGTEIHKSEVEAAIAQLPAQVRQQLPPQMLLPLMADQLATGRLLAEKGYAENLQNTDEVRQRVAQAELRIVQETWLNRQVDARITDAAIEQAYRDYLAANPPAEEVKARHILVASEDDAKALIRQLNNGADFATLARERSTDHGSGVAGGDLGWFKQSEMVAPFSDAAFALQPGSISQQPVQTQFGWHVIEVEDRRMSQPPSLAEVRDQLVAQIRQGVVQQVLTELRSHAQITVFGPDGQPVPN